jgi:hypothetical protein
MFKKPQVQWSLSNPDHQWSEQLWSKYSRVFPREIIVAIYYYYILLGTVFPL